MEEPKLRRRILAIHYEDPTVRRSLKRKLEQDFTKDQRNCKKMPYVASQQSRVDFKVEVPQKIFLLTSSSDPKAVKKAI
ncbi:hypothetical protein VNO77_02587 [Canavalia gladiata]|uniref:Uncharacterized protein n=1 Tax=Canavalia gladiata TaxID=3824 RepID=A0AAN9MT67_CANGL